MSELYAITVKKGGLFNTAAYTSKSEPVLIDRRFRKSMEEHFSTEELYPIFEKQMKSEPRLLVGPKHLLIEMVDTVTEQSFFGCRSITQMTTDKTADSLRRLVSDMPSPIVMAKGIIQRLARLGQVTLLGVDLVKTPVEPRNVFWNGAPKERESAGCFLQEYRKRLLAMASAGLVPEVDPDISLETISRELIFNHLAEQASLEEYGSLASMTEVLTEHQLNKELEHVLNIAA